MMAQGKFKSLTTTEKGTELKFMFVSGTKDEVISRFQKAVGQLITLSFRPAQMDIDDMEDDHEGIPYSVDQSGVAKIGQDQVSIDDYIDETSDGDSDDAAEEEQLAVEQDQEDIDDQQPSEDDLPDLTEQPDINPEDLPFPVDEDGPGF